MKNLFKFILLMSTALFANISYGQINADGTITIAPAVEPAANLDNNLTKSTENSNSQNESPIWRKSGKIGYQAYSHKYSINFGVYTYAWDIKENSYQIYTTLTAKGFISAFVDYYFYEIAKGKVDKGKLHWQSYQYTKSYHDKAKGEKHKFAKLNNAQPLAIVFEDRQEKVDNSPMDIPSLIAFLMTAEQKENKSFKIDLLNASKKIPVTISLQKTEKIKVPAGEFSTYYWQGKYEDLEFRAWYDIDTMNPIKLVFVLGKDSGVITVQASSIN